MTFTSALRASSVAAVLATGVVAAAGCGGSANAGTGPASGSGTNAARDAARLKFAQCMRDNGVNVPDDPGQGGGIRALGNVDQTKLQAAQKACQKYRQAAMGNITAAQRQEFRDAFTKFASCMRQHGVELPDRGAGGGPPAGGARIDRSDPKVQAAEKACQDKLPQGGRFGGGQGGS